jgi:hypothetical protein
MYVAADLQPNKDLRGTQIVKNPKTHDRGETRNATRPVIKIKGVKLSNKFELTNIV